MAEARPINIELDQLRDRVQSQRLRMFDRNEQEAAKYAKLRARIARSAVDTVKALTKSDTTGQTVVQIRTQSGSTYTFRGSWSAPGLMVRRNQNRQVWVYYIGIDERGCLDIRSGNGTSYHSTQVTGYAVTHQMPRGER